MSDVDEIKQRIDIVDLISQYAALKRAGRGFTALCPFHTERTPSFHVDPARQTWHCFGACSTGGDIFSFVMKKEGCDFREALTLLGERAGVALHQKRDVQEDARRARLYEANEAAAAYFAAQLRSDEGPHASGAAAAREYVASRHTADSAVEQFQLGYAPNTWDALVTHLEGRGFPAPDVVAAGLAIEGDRGAYDRFRHRLMFPIRDDRGRVAGFGGRLLPGDAVGSGDSQPKYVNTSQSQVFDKGAILYGLDLAKDAIRSEGRAVIVEGYMDAIAAHEHGYANVVASMGTALTERQVRHLIRQTKLIVLALDEDDAGIEATLRSVYEIVNNNLSTTPVANSRGVVHQELVPNVELRVLVMAAGKDPDDVIRSSPEEWEALVNDARPILDYVIGATVRKGDISTPTGRSAIAQVMIPWLMLTGDRIVQANYLQTVARITQTDEETLRLDMRQPARKGPRGDDPDTVPVHMRATGARDKKEEFCLALLFRYPELLSEGMAIDADLFGYSENRSLFETWVGWAEGGESFEDLLTPDVRPQYERILSISLPAYDDETLVSALRSTTWSLEQQRLRFAKRASAAVVSQIAHEDRSYFARRTGAGHGSGAANDDGAFDEADPAAVLAEDMEAGLKVHQRLLEQRRGSPHAAGEVVNDG